MDKEWDDFIAEYVPEDLTFEEWLNGLEPTGEGKLVFKGKSGESVDISRESSIIRENSKKSITTITDSAIERVPNVDISGYTEEQYLFIQQQHKELLKYLRDNNDNKEVAFVFDGELGNRKEFLGTEDDLDFKNELYGSNLLIMYNHPRNSSFSTTDIIFFCDNINVKTLTIAKNNGNVEYITKSSNYNKDILKLEYSRLYGKIIKQDTDTEKEKLIRILLTKTKSGVIWSGR